MKLTKTAVVACDQPHCDYVEVADGRSVTVRVRALFHHIDILHFGLGVPSSESDPSSDCDSDLVPQTQLNLQSPPQLR